MLYFPAPGGSRLAACNIGPDIPISFYPGGSDFTTNDDYRTMYARHRKAAGITQEKAAELLGVAVRTLANWEAGIYVPPDDKVALMCDAYPAPTLALEHLRASSALAAGLIPEAVQLPLAQAVMQLLYCMRQFEQKHRADDLIWISSNGRVDEGEQVRWSEISDELQDIVQAAIQLRYAQGACPMQQWHD